VFRVQTLLGQIESVQVEARLELLVGEGQFLVECAQAGSGGHEFVQNVDHLVALNRLNVHFVDEFV